MCETLRQVRLEQIRLQANVAAGLLIVAMSSFCGLRMAGLSSEVLWLAAVVLGALVTAGAFAMSPRD